MYCPLCHAEYRAGVLRCGACNVLLVAQPPEASPLASSGDADRAVVVWRGQDPVVFTSLVAALGEAGIPCHESLLQAHEAYLSGPEVSDIRSFGLPHYAVRVRLGDLEEARRILGELLETFVPEGERVFERDTPNQTEDSFEVMESEPGGVAGAEEAPLEVWSGKDPAFAEFVLATLEEHGVRCSRDGEPPGEQRVLVQARDVRRAREVIRQIVAGLPPS